jgi:hypothetical protein
MPKQPKHATMNFFDKYIQEQFEHYKKEAHRLKSKEPLQNFFGLLQSFKIVNEKLGGLEHDVALNELQKSFDSLFREVLTAIKQFWRNFWSYRELAAIHAKQEQDAREDAIREQENLRRIIAELEKEDNGILNTEMRSTLEELLKIESINLEFSQAWRTMSWTGLWIDAKILALYFQYFRARSRVFFQFHAFIFLIPILILGIGYSFASKRLVSWVASLSPSDFWVAPATIVALYAIKKYFIDKKLKKLQKAVETRLYKPLAPRLLLARNTALATKTLRMKASRQSVD